jgi:predicted dehydrogenase
VPRERRRVGWGIVGCGWVAHDYVAPALLAAGNAHLVALCDRDGAALGRVGRLAPDASATTDLDAFLATTGLDAVYVATPNASHPALVAAAARAGKAVLCEKPMARTAAEAAAMVAACAAAGVPYATAFDQRFHAAHRRLRALVAEGALGTVTCVRIHYACWTPPDWRPAGWAHDNWRADPAVAGGGAMLDLAPHGLDLVQTLLDEPIVRVACLLQRRVHAYAVDDGAVLTARTASGVLVSHTVAYNRPDAFPRRELEVIGTAGRALAVNTMGQTPGGCLTLTTPDGAQREVSFAVEDRSPFLAQVEAFGDALLAARPFPFPPARDLHTMRLLDACAREVMADVPFDARTGAWHPEPPRAGPALPSLHTATTDAAPALRL